MYQGDISIIRCFSLLLANVNLSSSWYVNNSVQLFHVRFCFNFAAPHSCFSLQVFVTFFNSKFLISPPPASRSHWSALSLMSSYFLVFHYPTGDHVITLYLYFWLHICTRISEITSLHKYHPTCSSICIQPAQVHINIQHFNSLEGNRILPVRYELNWSIIIIPILMISLWLQYVCWFLFIELSGIQRSWWAFRKPQWRQSHCSLSASPA